MFKLYRILVASVLIITNLQFIEAQFIPIISNLDKYNSLNINEQVYLQTNCEVYAPGDTIWFKAYVRNKASLGKSAMSNVLFVSLLDEKGNVIENEKTIITDPIQTVIWP
jgi:hypothetical protein